MKIVTVIATYNEEGNIDRLLPILFEEFKKYPKHEYAVVIVDDNSRDKTQELVNNFSTNEPRVHLLAREKKEGLGAAFYAGYIFAMKTLNADAVIEMDGDMQHDPHAVGKFIEKFDEGYDYVIGSRYITGGGIPKEWAMYRKILSWGGSFVSKLVLWIWNVHDFTTGYRITRVKGFLDQVDFLTMLSKGFAFRLELLYRYKKLGAKITEIPIEFGLRDRGDSKMERRNTVDSLKVIFRIRFREHKSFIKFLIVGTCGMVVDFTFANLFKLSGMPAGAAASLAAALAILTTFTLNNIWSFKDREIKGFSNIAKSLPAYFLIASVTVAFRFWFVGYSVHLFGDTFIVYNLAIAISIGLGILWNYFFYSRIIWRK